jgi:serine/threonine-protein kinase
LAGRAYGLLNLYKHTGEETWLERARVLATRAAGGRSDRGSDGFDFSHSLYKGDVGVAVLAADLLRPEAASMPFLEEEGWPSKLGSDSRLGAI